MAIIAGAVVVFVLLSETASLMMLFAARAVFGDYFEAPGKGEVRITRRAASFIASLRGRYTAERLAVIAETVAAALRRHIVAHRASQ